MKTQVLRINYNHCAQSLQLDYLNYREALERCVLATLMYIDKVRQPLANLHFENPLLQQHWACRSALAHHEDAVLQLGLHHYRFHLEDLHESLEHFLGRHHPPQAQVVYVGLFLDAACHLCIQFRAL